MLSFWEKEALLHADVAIVGGGITGMSVAASIKEMHPTKEVVIFERSLLPYGASTRNAGFACFGSLSEIASDIEAMGEEAARELIFRRWIGLQITRKRLGDAYIGWEASGGFELLPSEERNHWMESAQGINALVADFIPAYIAPASRTASSMDILCKGDLFAMSGEGQIHTGKLMRRLEQYVLSLGVSIRTGAQVQEVRQDGCTLIDPQRGALDFRAKQVVVCTNAFASQLLKDMDIQPGRGQVFITKPLKGLSFSGNLHLDRGFYYLRNVADRLLFGGARNMDFETENTAEFAITPGIQQHLEDKLRWIFGEKFNFEVDGRWSGIMAFGKSKAPIVRRLDEGPILAIRLSGMGVALAGAIGEEVAEMIA